MLSLRDKQRSAYQPKKPDDDPLDEVEYYVHYTEFNKRLDEWVGGSRLVLTREMELPKPKQEEESKDKKRKTPASVTPRSGATGAVGGAEPSLLKKALKTVKGRKAPPPKTSGGIAKDTPQDDDDTPEATETADGDDVAVASNPLAVEAMSKDDEIRRLRTSGSMTQQHSEISRVKNLKMLQIGKHEVESWYFSPYPQEYAHIDVLYICEFCLSYFPSGTMLHRHRDKCTLMHPPGNEIYRDDNGISFFEIDGRKQRTWCRNLCLLSKCFLDHKFLYFDVDPFLYYCMVQRDSAGCHLIGYFSKDKESPDGYNVACILTLPQHQRKGYGNLLIQFSYELSKVEKKHGSPEKPLSDLGLLSYRAYWSEVITELLVGWDLTEEITIEEIANRTCIMPADVMHTLEALHLIKRYKKDNYAIVLSEGAIEQYHLSKKKQKRAIDPSKLIWKPPVFTRLQLAFGY